MNGILIVDKYLKKVEYFLAIIAGSFVLFLMGLITLDVITRYFFHSALPGTYELVKLMIVAIVFLGVPYVQSIKGNISIDILTTKFSERVQRNLDLMGCLIGIFIIGLITWQTGIEAWKSFVTQDYTMGLIHFPQWPSKLSVTVGMTLLLIRLCLDSIFYFFGIKFEGQEEVETEHGL